MYLLTLQCSVIIFDNNEYNVSLLANLYDGKNVCLCLVSCVVSVYPNIHKYAVGPAISSRMATDKIQLD